MLNSGPKPVADGLEQVKVLAAAIEQVTVSSTETAPAAGEAIDSMRAVASAAASAVTTEV